MEQNSNQIMELKYLFTNNIEKAYDLTNNNSKIFYKLIMSKQQKVD